MIYQHTARRLKALAQDAAEEERVIQNARDILLRRIGKEQRAAIGSPAAVRDYLRLTLGTLEHEEFWAIWLDAQHRVIAAEFLFGGTLTQTSVYPREVVKAALRTNAAAVIFAHNHPSGLAEASHADQMLTQTLKAALSLVDCRTLDHFIVGGDATMSFAERGLL